MGPVNVNDMCALPRKAAARFIGVSDRRFAELTKSADFPRAVELGGPRSCRWLRNELEAYVASRPRRVVASEPAPLAAARAAKAAGRKPAPPPFNGAAA